jgi:hypothetical protein
MELGATFSFVYYTHLSQCFKNLNYFYVCISKVNEINEQRGTGVRLSVRIVFFETSICISI